MLPFSTNGAVRLSSKWNLSALFVNTNRSIRSQQNVTNLRFQFAVQVLLTVQVNEIRLARAILFIPAHLQTMPDNGNRWPGNRLFPDIHPIHHCIARHNSVCERHRTNYRGNNDDYCFHWIALTWSRHTNYRPLPGNHSDAKYRSNQQEPRQLLARLKPSRKLDCHPLSPACNLWGHRQCG